MAEKERNVEAIRFGLKFNRAPTFSTKYWISIDTVAYPTNNLDKFKDCYRSLSPSNEKSVPNFPVNSNHMCVQENSNCMTCIASAVIQ